MAVDVDGSAPLPHHYTASPERVLYRLQQPVLICLINAAAAGMARLVEEPISKEPNPVLLFARRLACVASALFYVGLLLSRLLRAHPDDDWAPLLEGRLHRATLRQKVKFGQALVTFAVAATTALLPDLVAHFARDQRAYKASRTIFLLALLSSALVASHLVDLAVGRRRRPSLSS